jgi:two-component system, OmpR family, sensor histidine kinase VicK
LSLPPNEKLTGAANGIEVIQDAFAIQRLYNNLIRFAKEEIMLFLPTTSAFLREEKIGIIQSLNDAANNHVRVKVITPCNESIDPKLQALFQGKNGLELRTIRYNSDVQDAKRPRTKILVVDRKEYLVVELKDDSSETFVDAVRLAIYSATESTVISYLTLFESLWTQAELYEQLERHEKMQNEFVNIAAHELRTPIQPLLSLVELLELGRERGNDEEVRGITGMEAMMIARNVKRLERLSDAILDSTRIETNTLKLHREKIDLNEKIRNTVQDARTTIRKGHNLEIVFEPTEKPVIVQADRIRIFEVLSNLLGNAIKFTRDGTIEVKLEQIDNCAVISVRDTGQGIEPEVMPKLFTRFVTGSATASGSGLGLYISRAIIEAHGGRMWAENNYDGKGATFMLSLPIAQ